MSSRMLGKKCLTWGLALASASASLAAPLDLEVCSSLKEEHNKLVVAGVKANKERGPEWARANLAPDKIRQIERLINVEELLAFRCPRPKSPLDRAETRESASAVGGPAASEPTKRASAVKGVRGQRKAKTVSAATHAAQTERRQSKKTPPRPKSHDAYVPSLRSNDTFNPSPKSSSTPPPKASPMTRSWAPAQ